MKSDEARRIVLETLEVYVDLQMKAIQELKEKTSQGTGKSLQRGRRRRSLVDIPLCLQWLDTPHLLN